MERANCYTGKVLRVDLTSGTAAAEPLNEAWAADFVGGKGLAFRYLAHELPAGVDPLMPGNVVAIFPGALAGAIAATTARTCLCTRSPASGTICDSYIRRPSASRRRPPDRACAIVRAAGQKGGCG